METIVKEKIVPGKTIQGGMTCVIVQNEITNFNNWKKAYEANVENRKKAGISELLVLRDVSNPNYVSVILGVSDVSSSKAFFNDPETAQLMREAGVISKPRFTYFKVSDSGTNPNPDYLIVRHRIAEYEKWKPAFDHHETVRANYNIRLVAVGKDLDDPANIVAVFNSNQASNFTDFLEKSNLKDVMHDTGVISEPVVDILKLA